MAANKPNNIPAWASDAATRRAASAAKRQKTAEALAAHAANPAVLTETEKTPAAAKAKKPKKEKPAPAKKSPAIVKAVLPPKKQPAPAPLPKPEDWTADRDTSSVLAPAVSLSSELDAAAANDTAAIHTTTDLPTPEVVHTQKPKRLGSRNSLRDTDPDAWQAIRQARIQRGKNKRAEKHAQAQGANASEDTLDVEEIKLTQARLATKAHRLTAPKEAPAPRESTPVDPEAQRAAHIKMLEDNIVSARAGLVTLQQSNAAEADIHRQQKRLAEADAALEDFHDPSAKQRRQIAELAQKIATTKEDVAKLAGTGVAPDFIARREKAITRMEAHLKDLMDPLAKPSRKLKSLAHDIAAHERGIEALKAPQEHTAEELRRARGKMDKLRGDLKKLLKNATAENAAEREQLTWQISEYATQVTQLSTMQKRLTADHDRLSGELAHAKREHKKLLETLPEGKERETASAPSPTPVLQPTPPKKPRLITRLEEKLRELEQRLEANIQAQDDAKKPPKHPDALRRSPAKLQAENQQLREDIDAAVERLGTARKREADHLVRRADRAQEREALTRAIKRFDPQRRVRNTLKRIFLRRQELSEIAERQEAAQTEKKHAAIGDIASVIQRVSEQRATAPKTPIETKVTDVASMVETPKPTITKRRHVGKKLAATAPAEVVAEGDATDRLAAKQSEGRAAYEQQQDAAETKRAAQAARSAQAEADKLAAAEAELEKIFAARRAAQAALPDSDEPSWLKYERERAEGKDSRPGYGGRS